MFSAECYVLAFIDGVLKIFLKPFLPHCIQSNRNLKHLMQQYALQSIRVALRFDVLVQVLQVLQLFGVGHAGLQGRGEFFAEHLAEVHFDEVV